MRLSNNVRKIVLEDQLADLRPHLHAGMIEAGFDPAEYPDVQKLIDEIPTLGQFVEPENQTVRFKSTYRLWASFPLEDYPNYWTKDFCSTTEDGYIAVGINGLYDGPRRPNYILEKLAELGTTDVMDIISPHITLFHAPNVGHIVYSVSNELAGDLFKKSVTAHPYVAAASLHELVKQLLEWQWAKLHAGNTEPVVEWACKFLDHVGLHVDDTENPVVQDLMALPDMHVAQYIKTGVVTGPASEEPPCPESFSVWAKELSMMEDPETYYKRNPQLADLRENCIRYKNKELEISRL